MISDAVRQWMQKGDHDLRVVQHELDLPEGEAVTDVACFHCQQCAEKYLKAFLTYHNKEVERTHNIDLLLDECRKFDSDFGKLDAGYLTDYAVQVRYPDDYYVPSMDELRVAYQQAAAIRQTVRDKLHIS